MTLTEEFSRERCLFWKNTSTRSLLFVLALMASETMGATLSTLDFASKFEAEGNHTAAALEYKRFIFAAKDNSLVSGAYYRLGLVYQADSQYAEAARVFRKAAALAANDSIKSNYRIWAAVMDIAGHKYSAGESELLRVHMFSENSKAREKAALFLIVCYTYAGKWESCRAFLPEARSLLSPGAGRQLDSLFSQKGMPRLLSPRTAKILSSILPGLGQAYVGKPLTGLHSLGVCAGSIVLLLNSVVDGRFGHAFFLYYPMVERYYMGSRFHAERLCNERNAKLMSKRGVKMLTVFQEAQVE